ncbi:hypothetical protein MYX76_00275 [Desulfobacterota bacterium AH_259_B03_O07]|nr:hypothetical protein [Desulfobacterota bacterium AH_259_B03_O07]
MSARERIVYSINVEDLQNVADQELDRELTDKEIEFIENRIDDYIDWYGTITLALNDLNELGSKN